MITSETDLFKAIEKYKFNDEVIIKVVRRANWQQEDEVNEVVSTASKRGKIQTNPSSPSSSPFLLDNPDSDSSSSSNSNIRSEGSSSSSNSNKFVLVELKVKLGSSETN